MDQIMYASLSHTLYWHEVGTFYLFTMVAPAMTLHFYLFRTITRASVSMHVRISAEYLYSGEHALREDGCTHIRQRKDLLYNMHLNHCVVSLLYREGG